MTMIQSNPKIVPFLWFDNNIEEAVNFYTSVFKNSTVKSMNRNGDGPVMSATFQLEGQDFYALNGGPMFKFTEAISFFINCETQEEVDEFWEKLSEGGQKSRCGWLKDKFGLSWQVVPVEYFDLINSDDPKVREKAMKNTFKQKKLILSELK